MFTLANSWSTPAKVGAMFGKVIPGHVALPETDSLVAFLPAGSASAIYVNKADVENVAGDETADHGDYTTPAWDYHDRTYKGCTECAMGTPVPHKASAWCRSGGRNHCTCDTCF